MALTLTARATLDNRPFFASLKAMQAGVQGLSKTQAAGSKAAETATDKRIAANQALMQSDKQRATAQSAAAAQQAKAMRATSLGLSAQRYLYADVARMTARAAAGVSLLPAAAIAAGAAWQNSFANVIRTADPAIEKSDAAVQQLRGSLVDMVQTMPTSWGDVTEIATLANQMGVASSETASFTRAVAMFSATSNVSVDKTATAFGRLNSIVSDVNGDYMGLADSILKVGVNSVATESEIIDIVTQISSIAGQAGFSSKEMIGLSGAMASVRVPPELSRGVVTRTFGQISRAVSDGGASLEGFANIAGMSATDFEKSWGTDQAGATFQKFVEGLQRLGPRAEAELRGLGITSVRDVPVLLRLASAADSEGNIGKLLDQTNTDAKKAAGETQRQYTIMANTVAAKFKMLGNNLMAFFDAVGSNGLGPIGKILDFLSEGLADFTNDLDKNFKLFGEFELPITNGELLGWVSTIGLAAGGLLALTSAAFKARQGWVTARQALGASVSGVGGQNTVVAQTAKQWKSLPGVVATSAGKVAATTKRMQMAMSPTSMKGQFAGTMPILAAAQNAEKGVKTAFTGMAGAASAAGRGIGAAAAFAFGPWGLLIGVLGMVGAAFIENSRAESTMSSDLAEDIARWTSVQKSVKSLEDVTVGKLFGQESKPFEEGFQTLATLQSELDKTFAQQQKDAQKYDPMGEGAMGLYTAQAVDQTQALKDRAEAITTIDDAFNDLVNGGNSVAAVDAITKFTKNSEGLMDLLNADEAKHMRRFFDSAFESNGLRTTTNNLEKLARGQLPEVRSALLGVNGAMTVTNQELANFEGGAEGFAAMAKAAEEAARGFISYSEALGASTTTDEAGNESFDMTKFNDALVQQIAAQDQWAANLGTAAKMGGAEFVDALVNMGTDSELPLAAIVQNFNEAGGQANGVWDVWMANIIRSSKDGATDASMAMVAAINNIDALLGPNMGQALSKLLTDDQLLTFSNAAQNLGKETAEKYALGIESGKYAAEQAIGLMMVENEMKINPSFDLTSAQLSLNTIIAMARGTIAPIQLSALPDLAKNAIWEVVKTADDQTGFVQVDAETGEAIDGIAHIVDEAGFAVGTVKLTADELEALGKVAGVKSTADNTEGAVDIYANDYATPVIDSIPLFKTVTVAIQTVGEALTGAFGAANPLGEADGGVVSYYAKGGVRESHVAQIAPAGTMRVWAEPETGGEAYIPLAESKRKRSLAILGDVASRFGYSLSNDTANFANGGTYTAQQMTRTRHSSVQGAFAGGLSASDRQFFAQMMRTVVVTAEGQRITGLTNNINEQNARFGR